MALHAYHERERNRPRDRHRLANEILGRSQDAPALTLARVQLLDR